MKIKNIWNHHLEGETYNTRFSQTPMTWVLLKMNSDNCLQVTQRMPNPPDDLNQWRYRCPTKKVIFYLFKICQSEDSRTTQTWIYFFTLRETLLQNPQGRVSYPKLITIPSPRLHRRDSLHAVVQPCGQLWDVALRGRVQKWSVGCMAKHGVLGGYWDQTTVPWSFWLSKSEKNHQNPTAAIETSKIHLKNTSVTNSKNSPIQCITPKSVNWDLQGKNAWHSINTGCLIGILKKSFWNNPQIVG